MTASRTRDWDPRDEQVLNDQCAAYDALRSRCPVAYSDFLQWSVLRHADVRRVLEDHVSFSNRTSAHLSVPHGMDPPEHGAYRSLLEPFFSPERMRRFEPVCRSIASSALEIFLGDERSEFIADFAIPFAVQAQNTSLGWPSELNDAIRVWTQKNQAATLAGDRVATAAVAKEFTETVQALLESRRRSASQEADDVTASLLRARVDGRPLTDEELVSIFRNWTVGEVTSVAASLGILAQYLATDEVLQARLRAERELLPRACEEILRVCGPLVANQRVATRDIELGGRQIRAGERVTLMWPAANRDDQVFDAPAEVRLERDVSQSLLFGAGIHVCPGAPLARLELRVAMEEILARTAWFELDPAEGACRRAVYPANGFAELRLRLEC
jgi:cytochrome P450